MFEVDQRTNNRKLGNMFNLNRRFITMPLFSQSKPDFHIIPCNLRMHLFDHLLRFDKLFNCMCCIEFHSVEKNHLFDVIVVAAVVCFINSIWRALLQWKLYNSRFDAIETWFDSVWNSTCIDATIAWQLPPLWHNFYAIVIDIEDQPKICAYKRIFPKTIRVRWLHIHPKTIKTICSAWIW